jgi:hypothetical protein
MIEIGALPSLNVAGLLREAIEKLHAARVAVADFVTVTNARVSLEEILRAQVGIDSAFVKDLQPRLRETARTLVPLSDVNAQNAMLAIIAAADLMDGTRDSRL